MENWQIRESGYWNSNLTGQMEYWNNATVGFGLITATEEFYYSHLPLF